MKPEDQVVSLELAKQLHKLGIKQKSLFYWEKIEDMDNYSLVVSDNFGSDVESLYHPYYSAYTVAELGETLPHWCWTYKHEDYSGFGCWFGSGENVPSRVCEEYEPTNFDAETEADARAKMLIYLIENDLLHTHA